ncbi:hypothetical protein PENSPDRAFT_542373, partial [Peniophora sp. CONT]
PGVRAFGLHALHTLAIAHDAIIEARAFQTYYANQGRRADPKLADGDLVYVSTTNLTLPKGRATKLLPKYVGPYPIVKEHGE